MGRQAPGFGLGIVDTRLSSDTLAAKGAGALDSAYTEAGPVPGVPVPGDPLTRWRPYVRAAQSVDVDLLTVRGGYARRAQPATVAYRLGSDADAIDYRDWQEPNLVTHWTAPSDYQSDDFAAITAAVLTDTHKIVVVAHDTGTTNASTWLYDPRTDTWTAGYDWGANQGLAQPICLAEDPTRPGRVLLWSGAGEALSVTTVAYYSDDGGVTWSLYGTALYDDVVAADRASVAVDPTGDWVMFHNDTQWASSDHGVTWETVASSLTGTAHSVVRGPSGYVVVYLDATSHPSARVLLSARSSFEAATDVEVQATSADDLVAAVDYDGSVYLWTAETADTGTIEVYRSDDGGTTWAHYQAPAIAASGTDIGRGTWDVGVAAAGALWLVGGVTGPFNSINATRMGGWSQVGQGYYGDPATFSWHRNGRWGYGTAGLVYLPFDTPTNMGWTTTNTGTIDTTPATGVGLLLSTTVGQVSSHATAFMTATAVDYMCGEIELQLNSGDIAANSVVLARSTLQDAAATGYRIDIAVGTDGFEVRDAMDSGNQLAEVTCDTDGSSGQLHVRWVMRQVGGAGKATVWWKLGEGSTWARILNDTTLTQGAAGTTGLAWGHSIDTGSSSSTWRLAGASIDTDWRYGIDDASALDDTPVDRVLGIAAGRPVPAKPYSYPVPDLTASGEDMGHLAGEGGPTYTGETTSLPAAHTYGIEHVHPDESPSPRRPWRATDTTAVRLVYDQGSSAQSWYGGALALVALRADFRQAVLSIDDGAGGVTTLGTLDKGWGSINYTLAGRTLIPRSGTATIDRYLQEGELVGGYVVMGTAGADVARRITRQSAGYWTTDSALQRVRIEVEGIDGTETASGSGSIVHHSGVLVVYPTAETARRYLRIAIAASQIVPDAIYSAGTLAIARVVGVGADPSWDWSRIDELSRTTTRAADGTLHVTRTGPRRRTVAYGWPDGVDLRSMRALSAGADWVGQASALAIGSEQDAWSSPLELVETQMRAGEVPCLVLPRLPADGTTITDPTLFLYGRVSSDSIGVSSVVGTEGESEVLRVDSLSVEEIP